MRYTQSFVLFIILHSPYDSVTLRRSVTELHEVCRLNCFLPVLLLCNVLSESLLVHFLSFEIYITTIGMHNIYEFKLYYKYLLPVNLRNCALLCNVINEHHTL